MNTPLHMAVDGGGTGTRLRLCGADGAALGEGRAGPSALGQGVDQAWRHILAAAAEAVADAVRQGRLPSGTRFNEGMIRHTRIGLGLSGAENPAWVADFARRSPPWAERQLVSDGLTAVLGAHGGAPGAVVSVGTGSVGVALHAGERVSVIGGWGWLLGDEGSGAWLGRQAVAHTQHAMDGREPAGPLAQAVAQRCGRSRAALLDWCARSGQSDFAALAPLVLSLEDTDAQAAALVAAAVRSVEDVVQALDPNATLSLVMTGSMGQRLAPRLRADMARRLVQPQGDACDGALRLLQQPWGFLTQAPVQELAA